MNAKTAEGFALELKQNLTKSFRDEDLVEAKEREEIPLFFFVQFCLLIREL